MGRHDKRKKTFKCPRCAYTCFTAEVLAVHDERYHASEELRPYACNVCSYRAKTGNVLKVHRYLKHEKTMPLSCSICSMPFKTRAAVRDHMPVHTGTRAFSCVHCGFTTKFRAALYTHIHKKHSGSALTSSVLVNVRDDIDDKGLFTQLPKEELCMESVNNNDDNILQQDMGSDQLSSPSDIFCLTGRDPILCPQCPDGVFATMEEFDFHLDCHRTGNAIFCPFCLSPPMMWTELQRHLTKHPEVPLTFTIPTDARICRNCNKIFENVVDQEKHQKLCQPPDICIKNGCLDAIVDIGTLQENVPTAFSKDVKICKSSDKVFENVVDIQNHENLCRPPDVSIKNEYSKPILDNTTLQEILQQAIPKESQLSCNACGMIFVTESHLKFHQMEYHRQEFSFKCACGIAVCGSYAWFYHSRFCGKQSQTWSCTLCPYVGRSKRSFQSHVKRYHEQLHKCPYCEYASHRKSLLNKHMEIFHRLSQSEK